MRKIEFRSWDKKEKKMEYSDDVEFSTSVDVDWYLAEISTFFGWISGENSRDQYELMQFTGLLDKNGKKIFEGDIVQIQNHNNIIYNKALEGVPKFLVEWFEQENAWWLQEYYQGEPYSVYKGEYRLTSKNSKSKYVANCENFKIIGNLYENPELIK